jgi:antitoxin component YwqK of YwqJK toxin-antitoxin module
VQPLFIFASLIEDRLIMNTSNLISLIIICFFTSFIFVNSGCKRKPEKIEVVQNYGTGEISRRYTKIDGKKEGLMIDYYPNGKLKGERIFENDIQVGKTTIYHKNGRIKEVQYYTDGKIHGGDTLFYETGQPEMVINFNKGQKDGYLRKWAQDGSLIYEAKYQNEVLVEVKGEPLVRDTIQK